MTAKRVVVLVAIAVAACTDGQAPEGRIGPPLEGAYQGVDRLGRCWAFSLTFLDSIAPVPLGTNLLGDSVDAYEVGAKIETFWGSTLDETRFAYVDAWGRWSTPFFYGFSNRTDSLLASARDSAEAGPWFAVLGATICDEVPDDTVRMADPFDGSWSGQDTAGTTRAYEFFLRGWEEYANGWTIYDVRRISPDTAILRGTRGGIAMLFDGWWGDLLSPDEMVVYGRYAGRRGPTWTITRQSR